MGIHFHWSSGSLRHGIILLLMILCCAAPPPISSSSSSTTTTTTTTTNGGAGASHVVDVGVILDLGSYAGKMCWTSMEIALQDFYGAHPNYTTRLVLHPKDSGTNAVEAASAAIDLLKNTKVKAIVLGPHKSSGSSEFISDIGNETRVPVISFSSDTGPPLPTPYYFVRVAPSDAYRLPIIVASIMNYFGWHQVVPVFEASDYYGSAVTTYLSDVLQRVSSARVPYYCGISPSFTDDQILRELYKLMTMQTRVFVVHMPLSLASRVFVMANEVGMMSKGYAWIVTDGIAGLLETLDASVIDSMRGAIGFKQYIQDSRELEQFAERWKRSFSQENPQAVNRIHLSASGLWAYDSVHALAKAVESVDGIADSGFNYNSTTAATDLASIGTSQLGLELLRSILSTKFMGLSGEFRLVNGIDERPAVSSSVIVNVVGNEPKEIGFWMQNGIVNISISRGGSVLWPGGTIEIPRGWEVPTNGKKLRVGVPVKNGFYQFIDVKRDPFTKAAIVTGYCKDVFEAVLGALPYGVPFEYLPFETSEGSGESKGSYDDLVGELQKGVYDVVIGDITILANRSNYAEFTLPYTESGVSMIVPVKGDDRRNAWIFTKPLEMELWITIGAFFLYTGIVIWILEHRVNTEFRGTPSRQVGMILWFSFSTLVFAHRERVMSNLTRFVLIIWVFVVLVLSSSYTASLTSLLTVQQLQPTVSGINDIIRQGGRIGYQEGSFVHGVLKEYMSEEKLQVLSTSEDYNEALSNGSVSAIVDELPYLRFVVSQYCSKFKMVGTTNRTAGFGFALPKGSPLVPEISRAILKVTESEKMTDVTKLWFGNSSECLNQDETTLTSSSLSLDSFKGLFFIAWLSSTVALLIFLVKFSRENWDILASRAPMSQKFTAMAKTFGEKKAEKQRGPQQETEMREMDDHAHQAQAQDRDRGGFIYDPSDLSPGAISLSQHEEGMFSPDQGLSSTEPGTPFHDDIAITMASQDRE